MDEVKKQKVSTILFLIPFGIFLLLFFIIKAGGFFSRFTYELQTPFTADTPMYYAIGKGMTHGLLPYQDLFETKPPMIFFTAAFSYWLTGDFYLCNLLSFFLLTISTLLPLGSMVWTYVKRKEKNIFLLITSLITALFVGLLLGAYDQIRSGEVQVELFGAAFISLYFLFIFHIDSEKIKWYSPQIIASSVVLMIGIMYKEPFLLVALFGALLLCKTKKDYLYKLLLPFAFGGVLGILLLACTGTLVPYVTIYLPHMMGTHISIYGSPWERMWNIWRIMQDMSNFSPSLLVLVMICFALAIGYFIKGHSSSKNITWYILYEIGKYAKIACAIFFTSFAVGLGGQYYNHHYIFAFPLYILFAFMAFDVIYEWMRKSKEEHNLFQKKAAYAMQFLLLFSSLSGVFFLPSFSYNQPLLDRSKTIKEDAKYVDQILDILGEDRYQFFGFNGAIFYAYTEHDPQGPVFFQDPYNFRTEDSPFVIKFKEQLEKTNVYIYYTNYCGVIAQYVRDYISQKFTILAPSKEINDLHRPETFTYTIYYRKGAF